MLTLHIMEGRLRGQEILLPEEGELVLGRAADGDLVMDDSAAPAQAIIIASEDGLSIKSLDQANLSVNRKTVEEGPLKEGDRIKLGKTRGVVVTVTRYSRVKAKTAPKKRAAKPKPAAPPREAEMGGSLKDTAVSDWLSYFCGTGKTGMVYLKSNRGLGKIFVKGGRVCNAVLVPAPASGMAAKRMLFRMFRWKEGTASFAPDAPGDYSDQITDPVDTLLLEGLQEEVILSHVESELPPGQQKLKVGEIPREQLKKCRPAEMMILGLVRTKGTVQGVIDHYSAGDVEASNILLDLLKRKFVVAP